ncbi:hypothetical protein A8C56_10350 [Niabella ginsenosidivorans]|uniref:HMA domain-containing protein n=1 Tax=Niabella ginsenosidivorans TaxID=1176587 RepID=A0A1A9IAQ5_9BACT|nr:heavy metal translocating P-type ATPase metal-binding domain-containing protein [Niabella ginsenosidivorans]ANH83840.1 hypothetical protein A8C56_10350 [Niabella ginsenosidivorans]
MRCYHCGDLCPDDHLRIEEKLFCCSGCKLVFELLNEKGLCTYYLLNEHPGQQQVKPGRKERFAFLDNEAIARQLVSFSDGKQTHVTFSIPHMHCSSCLWLLEHIGKMQPGIITSRVDFSAKTVFIIFDHNRCSLRDVAETLTAAGYEPWLRLNAKEKQPQLAYTRITQISVAGFCFANIMMLSLPEYFSFSSYLQEKIGITFRYIGLLLALPVLLYAAREFFVNAASGLRNGRLTIDCSIALAVLLTFFRSLYNLLVLDGNTYFDSMSGIVFFMLLGRWAQDKTQRSLVFDRDYASFFPVTVNRVKGTQAEPVLISQLREKDIIEVHDYEIIPADSLLLNGRAFIDYSFVTGESLPKQVEQGAILYAGGKQLGERLELMVIKPPDQGYLSSLWNREASDKDSSQNAFLHKAGNYFTVVVLVLTLGSALFWFLKGERTIMWNALTTTLIVACPCALLLAATFTNGNVLRIYKRAGLYLKNAGVITAMAGIDHVVLDKTGTITSGKGYRLSYHGSRLTEEAINRIASLLRHSTHPLSKAVAAHLDQRHIIPVAHFKNIPGGGIEGWVEEHHLKIGSRAFVSGSGDCATDTATCVFVRINRQIAGYFEVQNQYREGLQRFISRLKQHYSLSVLTGDNGAEQSRLKEIMGNDVDMRFHQLPNDKYEYIRALQEKEKKQVLVAGDGLNDAGALAQSNVGIAVAETGNSFTPASAGILDASSVTQLDQLLYLARRSKTVIWISFAVSVIYNVIGLYFALQGLLAPVIAAILMPVSSISILLLTFFLSEWYGRKICPVKK